MSCPQSVTEFTARRAPFCAGLMPARQRAPNIRSMDRSRLRVLSAALCGLLLVGAGAAHAQGVRDEALRNTTPEQREFLWQSMTPQQRAEFWQRLTPEQKQAFRQRWTPEQRDAMRARMREQRQRELAPGTPQPPVPPGAAAGPEPPGPWGMGPRRWSPEERQRLRDQIMESARDLRERPGPHMRMEHRKGPPR